MLKLKKGGDVKVVKDGCVCVFFFGELEGKYLEKRGWCI